MARILLVEDDRDALEIRKRILESKGHRVVAVSSAGRARDEFSTDPPESVVLDLRIPEAEDGLALIREFRAASREVRIVVVSGLRADIEGRRESKLVDVILSKPVRSEMLLGAI